MVSEDDISSMCGTLLKKSSDDTSFEFAHFSVREFLEHQTLVETPGLENYRISQSECYRLLATQSLRYLQLSNFVLDPLGLDNVSNTSDVISTRKKEGYSFHRLAAIYSLQMTTHADSHSILHGLLNSLFHPSKSSCLEFAKKLLSDDFRPIHLAAALNLPHVCDYLISAGNDPTTKSPFGTPLELSVSSFFRFLHDGFDSKSLKTKSYCLCSPVRTLFPSATQRNSTVEILERSGPDPNLSLQSEHMAMLLSACIIALVQNDFRVVQRLLSRGATLEDPTYTAVFCELMYRSSELIEKDTEPLLAFLQYIGSSLESESGWQLKIGRVIWSTAVQLGVPFTRDPTVANFRITLSKDALVTRAIAAIRGHDLKALQGCLADGRLDLSERHRNTDDEIMTLLHFAVVEDNLPATSHLAKIGSDTNIPAIELDERWLPIHHCSSIGVFEELLAYGAQATDVEAHTGKNIWHLYATSRESETSFFGSVAQRYPLETAEALLTHSKDGHTPLQLVLGSRDTSWSREERVERALEFFAICSEILGFWSIHEPLFGQAAEFGSERIIRRLIEVGARLDAVGPGLQTPLHRLGIESSSASVQCLKELYPTTLDMRFEGQLPLQLYLERCSRHEHPIENLVTQQLLTAETLESIDGKEMTLWGYYCNPSHLLQTTDISSNGKRGCCFIWAWLLEQHDAMHVYESSQGRSGLGLILSCLTMLDAPEDFDSLILPHVLAHAIQASCYWEDGRNEAEVLRFLQFAIMNQYYRLIHVLLEQGVSVSEVVDHYSSVQIACRSPLAISLCSTAVGKGVLGNMLDLCSLTHLNSHGEDGQTILHRLATTKEDGWQLHWLIRNLLSKGVDINKRESSQRAFPPIVHHIAQISLSCAEFLLKMGADPGLALGHRLDAAMMASYQGFRPFLEKILESSKSQGSLIDWKRRIHINLNPFEDQRIWISKANVVHITCWGGHLHCLAFYVDNNLISSGDLEAVSTEGWTAMHVSALKGNSDMIEYLSSNGCKVMPQTVGGVTPLHLAAQQGEHDTCKTLIRLGAKDVPDVTGMTPTMHASKSNDKVLAQLLSESWSSETQQHLDKTLPRRVPKALVAAMERAIRLDDIEECKKLYAIGCPIDVNIRGWSPLGLALDNGHVDIAEWLLDNGAKTTVCVREDFGDYRCFNVIGICLCRSELCKLLPKLFDHCIHDGSGWPLDGDSGLSSAIRNYNTEGLSILLRIMQERAAIISAVTSMPQAEVLLTTVNQEIELDDEGLRGTALHCAVYENNEQAACVLVDNGAVVDKLDSKCRSALMASSDQDMSRMLVHRGASLVDHFSHNILDILNWDIEVFRDMLSAYTDTNTGRDPSDTIPGFLRTIYDTRARVNCQKATLSQPHIVAFLEADIDLNRELGSGRSLMHVAIADENSSIFVLNSNLRFETTAPFPWHLEFWKGPSFLNSMWRHFRRKPTEKDFARIAHLQPTRGWSPLCHASANNKIDMIRNCLSSGADVDFEGSSHGSAVILASACGHLEAVRILVRAGASLSYKGRQGHRSVFTFCRSKAVRHWLLVQRFAEKRMIDARPHPGNDERFRPWAGTAVARLKLVGTRAMYYMETSRDYAGRLAKMRKEWRGKVIPPICLDGIVYGSG